MLIRRKKGHKSGLYLYQLQGNDHLPKICPIKPYKNLTRELNTVVAESVDNAIFNILLNLQNRYNITSGDVEPLQAFRLDELTEELTKLLTDIIKLEIWGC